MNNKTLLHMLDKLPLTKVAHVNRRFNVEADRLAKEGVYKKGDLGSTRRKFVSSPLIGSNTFGSRG